MTPGFLTKVIKHTPLEANKDNLYLIIIFRLKTNPQDHE